MPESAALDQNSTGEEDARVDMQCRPKEAA
jgi:hypothetical protein